MKYRTKRVRGEFQHEESSIDDGIALRPRLLKQQKTEVETPPASPKVGTGGIGILKNGGVPRFCTGTIHMLR